MQELIERYRWGIVAIFCVPLLVVVGYLIGDRQSDPSPLVIDTSQAVPVDVRVYVTGAVQKPGVYPIAADSRWIDALTIAGGAAPDADLNAINLAKRVQDEDAINVPRIGSTVVAGATQALININNASKADLMSLPGIGDVRASDIIDSRTKNGPFSAIDDLVSRDLVPDSVFRDIQPLITVN